jgi:nitrogen fixation NifU-like protein
MMDLEISRKVLLEHSRSKRNGQFPKDFTHEKKLTNPICGDHVHIQIQVKDMSICEIGYSAKACAICSASTSLMCEEVKDKNLDRVLGLSQDFESSILMVAGAAGQEAWPSHLESLRSFEHLRVNPTRRGCALLPWVILRSIVKEILL